MHYRLRDRKDLRTILERSGVQLPVATPRARVDVPGQYMTAIVKTSGRGHGEAANTTVRIPVPPSNVWGVMGAPDENLFASGRIWLAAREFEAAGLPYPQRTVRMSNREGGEPIEYEPDQIASMILEKVFLPGDLAGSFEIARDVVHLASGGRVEGEIASDFDASKGRPSEDEEGARQVSHAYQDVEIVLRNGDRRVIPAEEIGSIEFRTRSPTLGAWEFNAFVEILMGRAVHFDPNRKDHEVALLAISEPWNMKAEIIDQKELKGRARPSRGVDGPVGSGTVHELTVELSSSMLDKKDRATYWIETDREGAVVNSGWKKRLEGNVLGEGVFAPVRLRGQADRALYIYEQSVTS